MAAIIELSNSKEALFRISHMEGRKFEDDIIFYETDRRVLISHHNGLLYVTSYFYDVELSRTLFHLGSLLNITSLSRLEIVG